VPFVPLLEPPAEHASGPARWYWVRGSDVVLVDEPPGSEAVHHFLGLLDGIACWAADVDSAGDDSVMQALAFQPLMALAAQLDEAEWAIAGRAVQLAEWDRTHRFCGRCAAPTQPASGERARRCSACGLLAFPRLAPAVIVLVERDGTALLARNGSFPVAMYSTIAGFVEPGETLEEAVRREVHEEAGVRCGRVRYLAAQPWPFPSSLMIGFLTEALTEEITVDAEELAEARWFSRDEIREMVTRAATGSDDPTKVSLPAPIAIAHHICRRWSNGLDRV
jgi:NAD+ diphosphatase